LEYRAILNDAGGSRRSIFGKKRNPSPRLSPGEGEGKISNPPATSVRPDASTKKSRRQNGWDLRAVHKLAASTSGKKSSIQGPLHARREEEREGRKRKKRVESAPVRRRLPCENFHKEAVSQTKLARVPRKRSRTTSPTSLPLYRGEEAKRKMEGINHEPLGGKSKRCADQVSRRLRRRLTEGRMYRSAVHLQRKREGKERSSTRPKQTRFLSTGKEPPVCVKREKGGNASGGSEIGKGKERKEKNLGQDQRSTPEKKKKVKNPYGL